MQEHAVNREDEADLKHGVICKELSSECGGLSQEA